MFKPENLRNSLRSIDSLHNRRLFSRERSARHKRLLCRLSIDNTFQSQDAFLSLVKACFLEFLIPKLKAVQGAAMNAARFRFPAQLNLIALAGWVHGSHVKRITRWTFNG